MKNIKLISILLATFALVTFCKKDKYAEARMMVNEMISYEEAYAKSLGNAKTAAEVIQAAVLFGENFKKIKIKINEINQKYPELKEEKQMPADLKPLMDKSWQLLSEIEKLMQAAGLIYQNDPNVQKAFVDLAKSMEE